MLTCVDLGPANAGLFCMSGFLIDLASLPGRSSLVSVEADSGDLGLPAAEWTGHVRGDLQVEKLGEKVSVRGELEAVTTLDCVRCLKPCQWRLRVPFEVYAERSTGANRFDEQELERDHHIKFFDGRRLDLTEDAREALLLEVPMAPHCREDCRGLCPRCGSDLNDGPCECPQ